MNETKDGDSNLESIRLGQEGNRTGKLRNILVLRPRRIDTISWNPTNCDVLEENVP